MSKKPKTPQFSPEEIQELSTLIKKGDQAIKELSGFGCGEDGCLIEEKTNVQNGRNSKASSNDTSTQKKSKPNDISSNPKQLSDSKKRRLVKKAKEGRQAADKFTQANIGLVVYLTQKYRGRGLSEQDLIQEGCLALVQAVHRYDPGKGAAFSTYAAKWIDPVLRKAASAQNRVLKMSSGQVAKQIELNQAIQKLEIEFQRSPTAKELSYEMDVSEEKVSELLKIRSAQFSAKSIDADEEPTYMYENEVAVEDAFIQADSVNQLVDGIGPIFDELDDLGKKILELRFGLNGATPMTLEDVAKKIQQDKGGQVNKVTKEKIRYLEEKAINTLQKRAKQQFRDTTNEGLDTVGKDLLS